MKPLFVVGILALTTSAALAGGLHDPVVTPEVVFEAAAETAGSDEWVGVLMTFLTIILLGVGG